MDKDTTKFVAVVIGGLIGFVIGFGLLVLFILYMES